MQLDNRQFYKNVSILVLPMAIQNLINVGVTSADVVMLGKVGETALSSASLANQVYFILSLLFFGVSSGACVLTAQYWGKGDTRTIEKILGISLRIAVIVSFLFTVVVWIMPKQIMEIFTNESTVIEGGIQYLRIVSISYVFSAITNVYLNIIRSIEKVVVATVVFSISLLINIVLNAIFIFGLFGCPAMGVAGAALGTLCARAFEIIAVLFYAFRMNDIVKIRFEDLIRRDKSLSKDFNVYAVPVLLNELAWGSGMAVISAIIGHLGSASVAAHSVTQVCRQLAMVVCFGIANATSIMIGKAIGENKEDLAKEYGRRFVKLSLILGILGSLIILGISPIVRQFLNLTPLAKNYLRVMMIIMAYYAIGQALNTTLIVGVFRAGGDTKFGLILDVSVMWICSIGFAAFAAFVIKVPMPWVYIILCSDEIIKIPITLKRYYSLKWLNHVTREGT